MKSTLFKLLAITLMSTSMACSADSPDSLTVDMAKSFASVANNGSPRMVDEYTRMERVYSESLNVIFDYKILDEIPEYSELEHRSRLRNNFVSVMCATPKFHDQLLSKGVTQTYRYLNNEGELLHVFTFSIKDCE